MDLLTSLESVKVGACLDMTVTVKLIAETETEWTLEINDITFFDARKITFIVKKPPQKHIGSHST